MKVSIIGTGPRDVRGQVLAIEAVTRSLCRHPGQDPAEGVMLLLIAAAHLSKTYSKAPASRTATVLAECLGHAIVAADDFFQLKDAGGGADDRGND